MARIAGVDLPASKHISIALRYIFGIGPAKAKLICEATGIAEDMLSHVLKGRKDLSLKALQKALERISYVLRITPVPAEAVAAAAATAAAKPARRPRKPA